MRKIDVLMRDAMRRVMVPGAPREVDEVKEIADGKIVVAAFTNGTTVSGTVTDTAGDIVASETADAKEFDMETLREMSTSEQIEYAAMLKLVKPEDLRAMRQAELLMAI